MCQALRHSAVLTAVETESFSGYIWPQLLDVFPGQEVTELQRQNFLT
jgi:hypothetical protein